MNYITQYKHGPCCAPCARGHRCASLGQDESGGSVVKPILLAVGLGFAIMLLAASAKAEF